ncbi:H+-ATPase G subunit-domain-containing protein [Catenaria anguillulae PL171]|uniref:V-type proton ATPase subunit G n=1 Tax=Catenaria anguillulae PL171 TaxID=765915 RepID=A0A1Y2HE61_9FUNG|nr:H+-ATPase G subunit-domain-containing protein [Catenaria anguillulae PL171]
MGLTLLNVLGVLYSAAQNSSGIQTLLEAEKEAGKIVQRARQYRVDRLKEARKEAEKEILALKQQKVAEYAKFEKENSGNKDAFAAKIDQETEARLAQTVTDYEKGREAVIAKLVGAVTRVEPKLHQNAVKGKIHG